MATVLNNLPPVLERYELKYLVPYAYVEPITRFIAPYCLLDHYSNLAHNHFYTVNSLYFDTRGCEFLKQRMFGKDSRFNIRVRAYAEGNKAPYFMEIKHKVGAVIKKYRATASEQQWPHILSDPCYRVDPDESSVERANKELFLRLAHTYAIEPKVLTQYKRRAFFSTVNQYARLTMDIDMKYRLETELDLVPDSSMTNYDNENIYTANELNQDHSGVVLELKCNVGEVPMWMVDLVRHFELRQTGFSKYLSSMLVSFYDNGYTYMAGDRLGIL